MIGVLILTAGIQIYTINVSNWIHSIRSNGVAIVWSVHIELSRSKLPYP